MGRADGVGRAEVDSVGSDTNGGQKWMTRRGRIMIVGWGRIDSRYQILLSFTMSVRTCIVHLLFSKIIFGRRSCHINPSEEEKKV